MVLGGRGRGRQSCAAALALTSIVSPYAWAQTAPQVSLPSREEIQRRPQESRPAAKASVRSRGAFEAGPCPDVLVESSLTVSLSELKFTGIGGVELPPGIQAVVKHVGSDLIGKSHPIRIVCDVRDNVSKALAEAGYVATVRVPEQTIEGGSLQLEIVTARIAELRIRGEPGASRKRIEAALERLRQMDPLNEREAERLLLIANDNPGTAVTLELRPLPGGQPGDVIGEVALEQISGALFVNAHNYGSKQIGRIGGLAHAELYGLTGLGDRTYVGFYSTPDFDEQRVVMAGHDFAFTNSGLRVGTQFSYAWTAPDVSYQGTKLDVQSRSLLASITATYPLLRSANRNLRVGAGMDFIEQRTGISGIPINEDKLRVLNVRADADIAPRTAGLRAPSWRASLGIELRKGFDIIGATKRGGAGAQAAPTRYEGDPEAFVVRGETRAEVRRYFGSKSPYAVTVASQVSGQYSRDPLLSFEEFSVGNLSIGRGYDPGSATADRAVGSATELRVGMPAPLSRADLAWEAFGFYDAVRIWNLDSGTTETNRTLASYGGGVRLTWGSTARLEVLYARPRNKAQTFDPERPGGRMLMSLIIRAWPWLQ